MDSLPSFMTSFKHFEKKLDKLQEDVSTHGQTLSELQNMVAGLASTGSTSGEKVDRTRRAVGTQYDINIVHALRPVKQPLSNKLKAKSFQGDTKHASKPPARSLFRTPKKSSLPTVTEPRRLGKTDRLEKSERQTNVERAAMAERLARAEKLARAEMLLKVEKPKKVERLEKAERMGKAEAHRKTKTLRNKKSTKLDKKRAKPRK